MKRNVVSPNPNFEGYVNVNPLQQQHTPAFLKWMIDFHNAVNAKLRKSSISLEEAYIKWK
jgi:hypothetical protein